MTMPPAVYFLTSARVGFRTWSEADLPLALSLWGDPQVTHYIDSRGALSPEEVKERLQREIATQQSAGVQYWPIFLLANGDFLGCAGLRPHRPAEAIYEFGVHLRAAHWGQGYATEAGRAALQYAFERLGAKGVFAGHHPRNQPSRRMLIALGFRYTRDELYPPTGLHHPSYLMEAADLTPSRPSDPGA